MPLPARQRKNRARRRATDAGQLDHLIERCRKLASVPLHQDLRCTLQVARTRVVTESGPQVQHFVGLGVGKIAHRGKARHETLVVADDRADLRLLQHDLGDPDTIRRAVLLPRQVLASVTLMPAQERRRKKGCGPRGATSPVIGRALHVLNICSVDSRISLIPYAARSARAPRNPARTRPRSERPSQRLPAASGCRDAAPHVAAFRDHFGHLPARHPLHALHPLHRAAEDARAGVDPCTHQHAPSASGSSSSTRRIRESSLRNGIVPEHRRHVRHGRCEERLEIDAEDPSFVDRVRTNHLHCVRRVRAQSDAKETTRNQTGVLFSCAHELRRARDRRCRHCSGPDSRTASSSPPGRYAWRDSRTAGPCGTQRRLRPGVHEIKSCTHAKRSRCERFIDDLEREIALAELQVRLQQVDLRSTPRSRLSDRPP